MRSKELYKKPVSMRLPDDDPARVLFHKAMGHILTNNGDGWEVSIVKPRPKP